MRVLLQRPDLLEELYLMASKIVDDFEDCGPALQTNDVGAYDWKTTIRRLQAGRNEILRVAQHGSVSLRAQTIDGTGREYFVLPERVRTDLGPVFDTLELAPVAQVDSDGACEPFETVDDIPEELRDSAFWSIYGHTPGEGVQCLGDFTTRADAIEVLMRLLGDLRQLGKGASIMR
jgi:hypothetical protein